MKHAWMFVLLTFMMSAFAGDVAAQPTVGEVIHVATALDHLTVLEFGEPVSMAAAGSPAFAIERHEDKVFIKPLKAGASTDLFVWTASRRFAYELEVPGEVKNMSFVIDNRLPAPPKPAPDPNARLDEIADMMLTRAFLGAEHVDSASVKDVRDGITVRIEHVYQSRSTLYVHYTVVNRGGRPWRVVTPAVEQVVPAKPGISLLALRNIQLNHSMVSKLGHATVIALPPAHAEIRKADLAPDEYTQGIIAVRQKPDSPFVLKLSFGANGRDAVDAVVVL